jgi:hypothetical protein
MWIGFRVILTFTFVWLAPELGRTDNHQVALGLDGGHPAIARVLAGIRRAYGTRQGGQDRHPDRRPAPCRTLLSIISPPKKGAA